MSTHIEEYALLSDLETAAMVGRDGSVDWLCLPRFDSPACCAALLGGREHGRWRVAPVGSGTCARRAYRRDTLVLDSEWETGDGAVRVTDFMPPRDGLPCLVRLVVCLRGTVRMRSELRLRFHHGRVVPWVREAGDCTVAVAGPDAVWARADGGGPDGVGCAAPGGRVFTLSAGERVALRLVWAPSHLTAPPAPLAVPAGSALASTVGFWRRWAARCRYRGPYEEAVRRSLITLKALTYAPTGGIVAAPTTSLPQSADGGLNRDRRYCWLRDSTLALSCLLHSGYREEAAAWLGWLMRTVAGDPGELQAVYGLAGQRLLPETEAPWLPGYAGARPVRFGSLGARLFQLDVYGEVLDTLLVAQRAGIPLPPHLWSLVNALMTGVAERWRGPDHGLWELRGAPRQFVHSKVMAWVAADRALRLGRALGRNGSTAEWRALRSAIRREVCRDGWDPRRRTFVQSYGSTALDASALLLPRVGFLGADDPRARTTLGALRGLRTGGFVRSYGEVGSHGEAGSYREVGSYGEVGSYEESRAGSAVVACSLWYADALAATGRAGRARAAFERVLAVRSDVGLLAEAWDPEAGLQRGNAPGAFSHVALVETAFALRRTGADAAGADAAGTPPAGR
ncbi:glycoside hydrolase family 15 protein [Streptomyces sp. Da 82-17]|uniref:glycoside hydrolase family 15 protein n=1 Tax=Streptomyces sp. Da 82-17 TaxID=3377116 RepID=UPI0038D3E621